MAHVLESRDLGDGRRAVIVETSSSGGGRWGRPGVLTLAVLAPDVREYTRATAPGVQVVKRVPVDTRSTGPRSAYYAEYVALTRDLLAVS